MQVTRLARLVAGALSAFLLAGCDGPIADHALLEIADDQHPFPTRETSDGAHRHDVRGIDIAKWQGDIDWEKVAASGVDFAFIKATEGGDRLDDRFQANWNAARAAGLPRGAYHFNYWCSSMAAQAEWFKRNVPVDPEALPPVLDLEWNFQSPTCPKKVPRETAQAEVHAFVNAVERHYRKKPILYTDIVFYRDVLNDGSFSDYPLWVRSVKDLPQERYPGRQWAFWQYTERGSVPGIQGHVDKNAFAGSKAQWRRLVETAFHGERRAR